MYFLSQIFEKVNSLLKLNLDSQDSAEEIKKTINETLYLLIQKSVLSGEYYEKGALDKIKEIDICFESLELGIVSHRQNKELREMLSNITTIPAGSSDAATEDTIIKTQTPVSATTESENAEKIEPSEPGEKPAIKAENRLNNASPIPLNSEYFETNKLIKKFRDKYLDKLNELTKSVTNNLDFFSSGQEGIIADTKLLKNYKLKNELAETLGSRISLDDILNDSLFELNILLAYMDEYLECNDEMQGELKSIRSYLKNDLRNNLNGEIFGIIKYKADFLEFKISWRNCHDPENSLGQYPELDDNNVFHPFEKKLILHYKELRKYIVRKFEKSIEEFSPDKLEAVTLEEFHHLNRYYKKILSDTEEYRKILICLCLNKTKELGGMESGELFDQIAYKSIFNLLSNSSIHLALKIEEKDNYALIIAEFEQAILKGAINPRSEFLNTKFNEIKHIVDSSYLSDFYCYKILLGFVNEFIWYLQSNPERIIVFDKKNFDEESLKLAKDKALLVIASLKSLAQQVLKEFKLSLRKMMTHEVKPAYLTFKECLVPHRWNDGREGSLFVHSSYILPNNFIKIKTEIASRETMMDSQYDHLRNSIEMKINHLIIDYKNTSFEKKVKDNEFKLVQIIAMFVSIATFVLINVKIFDNKSGLESFAIILGLAGCFVLFNLFFYFIIMAQMQQSKLVWHRVLRLASFFLVPVLLCIGSYFLLDKEGEKSGKEIKSIKEKIRTDSIENRIRIDALTK